MSQAGSTRARTLSKRAMRDPGGETTVFMSMKTPSSPCQKSMRCGMKAREVMTVRIPSGATPRGGLGLVLIDREGKIHRNLAREDETEG